MLATPSPSPRRPPLVRASLRALLLLVTLLLVPGFARAAEPLLPKDVPDPLKPWTTWALDGHEGALCPTLEGHADSSRCAWPARLELSLDEHGGRFAQSWHLDTKGWVPLPGDTKRWPSDVKVGAARAVLIENAGGPSVFLEKGDHTVTGAFAWDSLPDSLHVPPETGLLALTLRGSSVASPNRDVQGTVWLQNVATNEEGNALELVVHRKVTDDIPLVLTTRLELHVSGKSREELLGKALPPGFIPLSLGGDLPARLEPDGRVRVQVRPGVFTIELAARSEGVVASLTRPAPDGVWRDGEEVWVFEARNDYRIVTLGGAPTIDPQQTTLPDAWKRLPAYALNVGDTLTFTETRRGDSDPPPDQLTLARALWLDFEGTGLTASDTITGSLTRESRLTMASPTVLGRVAIGGKDQFITTLADPAHPGVEIRQGTLEVKADSRIPGDPSDIPAVGWAHDFHQVSGTLHLPPGWSLFHASGVDEVPGTWVRHWSLLELFLALVITIGIGRLYGAQWGGLALATLVLTFPEDGAPKWVWVFFLVVEALFRALPAGKVKGVFGWIRSGAAVLVALVALPFLVDHVRQGIYPALAHPDVTVGAGDAERSDEDVDAPGLGGMQQELHVLPAAAPAQVAPLATARAEPSKARDAPEKVAPAGSSSASSYGWSRAQSQEVYDPTAVVQTGPGLPRWGWKTVSLRWSGPVTAAQRLHLYLLSPTVNLVLAFLRAALLVLLFARVVRGRSASCHRASAPSRWSYLASRSSSPRAWRAPTRRAKSSSTSSSHASSVPRSALPACASSSRMAVDARAGVLRIRLEVDAAAATAVPLPGSTAQWSPTAVLLDGQPARGLARLPDGTLWIELAAGPHQIALEGPLPDGASMQLALRSSRTG